MSITEALYPEIDSQDPRAVEAFEEWRCHGWILWHETDTAERCGQPIGWGLREVQDTYDSGYEVPSWTPCWDIGGGRQICEDCLGSIEDPSIDETSTTVVMQFQGEG